MLAHLAVCLSVVRGQPHTEATGVVSTRVIEHEYLCLKWTRFLRTGLSGLRTGMIRDAKDTKTAQYAQVA